jgi:hypothetical protein
MSFELVVDTFFSRIEQVKNCFSILVDGSQSLASSDVPEPANARYLQATHPSSSNVLVMTTTPRGPGVPLFCLSHRLFSGPVVSG